MRYLRSLVIVAAALALPRAAAAQTDEIQVYDGGLADPGVFNLTWHNNYIADGLQGAPYPGGLAADKSFNGVTEWAYGVTDWFEAGLYLPLYSHDDSLGWGFNGGKLRLLFASPHADDRRFFYGSNFEFSFNAKRWDSNGFTSEIRPIIGWHLKPIDIIVNPILDTAYDGFKNLDFAPSTRIAYNLSPTWAIAAEEYADFGPLHQFYAVSDQSHQLYGVFDYSSKTISIEGGVGFGLTSGSDNLTFKLLLSKDLNSR